MKQVKTEQKPFVVMAKPVGSACNMRCSYCYYLGKEDHTKSQDNVMSERVLDRMIRQTMKSAPGQVVSFIWHGGEPTLAGLDFFKKVVMIQKKYLPKGKQVWNNLQTNGLLLNEEWCRFLKENHFDVGISIDGCEAVHDKNRCDVAKKGTYQRTKAAIERLQHAGLQPDLLCTVNADSCLDPLAVYRGLKELNTGWIQFIPIVVRINENTFSQQSVDPQSYGKFLCTIFDEWISQDLGKLDVQLFAETARVWAGGQASLCWMTPTCGRVVIAEKDGSVYACDHFVDEEHYLGSLTTGHIQQFVDGPDQSIFGNRKQTALTQKCISCPWLSCCNGGCLKDRFAITEDKEAGQYYLCEGLRQFFAHADKPLHQMMEMSRRGYTNAKIMRRMQKWLDEKKTHKENQEIFNI